MQWHYKRNKKEKKKGKQRRNLKQKLWVRWKCEAAFSKRCSVACTGQVLNTINTIYNMQVAPHLQAASRTNSIVESCHTHRHPSLPPNAITLLTRELCCLFKIRSRQHQWRPVRLFAWLSVGSTSVSHTVYSLAASHTPPCSLQFRAQHHAKLFNPFFRLHPCTSTNCKRKVFGFSMSCRPPFAPLFHFN